MVTNKTPSNLIILKTVSAEFMTTKSSTLCDTMTRVRSLLSKMTSLRSSLASVSPVSSRVKMQVNRALSSSLVLRTLHWLWKVKYLLSSCFVSSSKSLSTHRQSWDSCVTRSRKIYKELVLLPEQNLVIVGDDLRLSPGLLCVPEPDDAGVPLVPGPAPPHRALQVSVLPGPGSDTLPDTQEVTFWTGIWRHGISNLRHRLTSKLGWDQGG